MQPLTPALSPEYREGEQERRPLQESRTAPAPQSARPRRRMTHMTRLRRLASLSFLVVTFASSAAVTIGAAGADPADNGGWVLTTPDFHSNPVTLKSIDGAGVHV